MSRTLSRLARSRDGAVAVEAAFVLPVLLLTLLGTVEVSRALSTRSALQFAVEEAARCAAVQTSVCSGAAATQAFAASRVEALDIPASAFAASRAPCGERVRGQVVHDSALLEIFSASPTLRAEACRR